MSIYLEVVIMNNLRQTLDVLYSQSFRGDKFADEQIDILLSKAFAIEPMALFLHRNYKKKFYETLNNLVLDKQVSDFEVARSLSSLLNHALTEMEDHDTNFIALNINSLSSLLNSFLQGEIAQDTIKEYFRKYLI